MCALMSVLYVRQELWYYSRVAKIGGVFERLSTFLFSRSDNEIMGVKFRRRLVVNIFLICEKSRVFALTISLLCMNAFNTKLEMY